jgi:hypothetical protein
LSSDVRLPLVGSSLSVALRLRLGEDSGEGELTVGIRVLTSNHSTPSSILAALARGDMAASTRVLTADIFSEIDRIALRGDGDFTGESGGAVGGCASGEVITGCLEPSPSFNGGTAG